MCADIQTNSLVSTRKPKNPCASIIARWWLTVICITMKTGIYIFFRCITSLTMCVNVVIIFIFIYIISASFRRRPAIVDDELFVEGDRVFRGPRSKWIFEVDFVNSKRVRVAVLPLEVVHQRPKCVSDDVTSVQRYGYGTHCKHRCKLCI